jgi:hypothetical protein
VGLFDRGFQGRRWHLRTLDNGAALPAAPAIYDLPLTLLTRLARPLGPALAPQLAAARLISRLVVIHHFSWPLENGIVRASGAWWLVAELPVGHRRSGSGSVPLRAVVYRWDGRRWAIRGRVRRIPARLDAGAYGGWFVSVPQPAPAVGFRLAGSDPNVGPALLTNAGGRWQVERR